MTSRERGLERPLRDKLTGTSIKVDKNATLLSGTNGVFLQTNAYPDLLETIKPLLDRTNTPRGALRSISLGRNFTNKKWLYNKSTSDDFNPALSKKEV